MSSAFAGAWPFDALRGMAAAAHGGAERGHRERQEHRGWDGGFGPRGRRGGPWGPGPFPGFGGPPFWGPPRRGRGPNAKRGDVRVAILGLLAEEPRNGYQIIQEIDERSGGAWKPSPGAVYPALQQLADEGLIASEESEGRKTFQLTDAGRAYVEEHADEVEAPWEAMRTDLDGDVGNLFKLAARTGAAIWQVAQAGSESQIAEAGAILAETRRKLYHLLAEDDAEGE